jgi:hypothetical protein
MAHRPSPPISGHLWSVALLVAGTVVALAAERLSSGARAPIAGGASLAALGDIGGFMTPLQSGSDLSVSSALLHSDPFDAGARAAFPVAQGPRTPTVRARAGRQLTAILVADDRPVAVIDGALVNVGDVLPDGGRVASIRGDRVAISERNGQMHVLTIASGRR